MTGISGPLSGVVVVECASFVAVPSAGLALAQMGADVIRVDPPGGASDINRWPLAPSGTSLFWASLNKSKRSVVIDLRRPEGRELLVELATMPGPGAGVLMDNLVGSRRPTYDELISRRPDAIHVRVEGRSNGAPAVDYTINAEVGVPLMTGPQDSAAPVNHVVPAWDLVSGALAASAVSAALLRRAMTGEGSEVAIALADVALASVGNMGWLAEADIAGESRPRHGNHMFGSFGVDFETKDHRRVMVVALTDGQWGALVKVTETGDLFDALATLLDADLHLESHRYRLRESIAAVLRPWFQQRPFAEVTALLDSARVLWSPYLDMAEVADRARSSSGGFASIVDQYGVGEMLSTGSPVRWESARAAATPAPRLGADTEQVLTELLGLDTATVGRLAQQGVVGLV